jgi:hypothetical protein
MGSDHRHEDENVHPPDPHELEDMVAALEVSPFAPASIGPQHAGPTTPPVALDDAIAAAMGGISGLGDLQSELERRRQEREAGLRRFRDASKRRASLHSDTVAQRLAGRLIAWRDVFDAAAPEPDGVAPWVPETTPVLFIRSSAGGTLRDSQVDGSSWAKWECTVSADAIERTATERVSFYHLWQNPGRRTVLVDVNVGMTVRGHAGCEAHGMGVPAGWFWPDTRSDVDVSARLTVWPLWIPEAAEPVHTVPLASISARAGSFGDAEATAISANVVLRTARYAVPREAYILIEASVVGDFTTTSGDGEVDLATGSFRVDCPYCVVIVPT